MVCSTLARCRQMSRLLLEDAGSRAGSASTSKQLLPSECEAHLPTGQLLCPHTFAQVGVPKEHHIFVLSSVFLPWGK